MKIVCLLVTTSLLMASYQGSAQTGFSSFNSQNNLQYGASIKATLYFDLHRQYKNPYFRIGVDFGVASTFIDDWLYPSINIELQLYNGGLGTRNRLNTYYGTDFDFVPAFTLTAGWPNRLKGPLFGNRYLSLYYFSNFTQPALQNPYDHSLSVGTLWSISSDTGKKAQRLGFVGLNFGGGVQFSYYNDGGPGVKNLSLGDGDDRYHTGGGMFSYNGPKNTLLNTVEVAYHKFTGFGEGAFEASNELFLAYMYYPDQQQQFFNRSMFDFNFSNPFRGYGLDVQWYNSVTFDLQHDLHTGVLDTYHMVPYSPPYFTFGLSYYGAYQQTGYK